MKQTFVVEQDDREPELQLLADINCPEIQFRRCRMAVGDYRYGDILIERKEINDFCMSILDGRITEQGFKMEELQKLQNDKCFVIIVGNMKDRKADIHENCILGKVVSLVVKHDIKVLWVEDEFQFLWVLKNIIDKSEGKVK